MPREPSTGEGRIGGVPTLNIKDPEVYRLAKELAARTHTSMTGAVRAALEEAVEKTPPQSRPTVEEILEMGRQVRADVEAAGGRFLTDEDLYDEWGLPK